MGEKTLQQKTCGLICRALTVPVLPAIMLIVCMVYGIFYS